MAKASIRIGSSAFLTLQRQWYAKLERTGFKDIELSGERMAELDSRNARVRDRNAVESYYAMAQEYLNTGTFRPACERAIWELHSEGFSLCEIALALEHKKNYVDGVIRRHRFHAGLVPRRT